MFAPSAPARLNAIFDWEMSTIGDPLADLGYLCTIWVDRDDPSLGMFELNGVTREEGFPLRAELVARYEERSGRSMTDIRWYQTLALWKSIVFMEGNYKRAVAGATDDPYLKDFGDGVVELAERAEALTRGDVDAGLLVDWGGVLTTNLFAVVRRRSARPRASSRDRCATLFRHDEAAREPARRASSAGASTSAEFERRFGAELGLLDDGEGLIERMFAGSAPDEEMLERRAGRPRRAACRTGLISNSWGTARYPQDADGRALRRRGHLRPRRACASPTPEIYALGAERIGLPPEECVFVDDLGFNLKPAGAGDGDGAAHRRGADDRAARRTPRRSIDLGT